MNQTTTVESRVLEIMRACPRSRYDDIMQGNKGLPMCQRRCFVEDSFEDGGVIDRMFIEVSYAEYLEWDREHKKKRRNEEQQKGYQHISIDYMVGNDDSSSFAERLASGFDLEADVLCRDDIRAFRQALGQWKPWAIELLEIYLDGKKRSCTQMLCEKYCVSAVVIRKRKRELEGFTRKFFEDRGFVLK